MSGAGGDGFGQRTGPTGIGQFPGQRIGGYGSPGGNVPPTGTGWQSFAGPGMYQMGPTPFRPDGYQVAKFGNGESGMWGIPWGGSGGFGPSQGQPIQQSPGVMTHLGGQQLNAGIPHPGMTPGYQPQIPGANAPVSPAFGTPFSPGTGPNVRPQTLYDFRDLFGQQQAQINQAGLRGMAALQQNQINPMLSAF